jgi:spore maturation protein CgeB
VSQSVKNLFLPAKFMLNSASRTLVNNDLIWKCKAENPELVLILKGEIILPDTIRLLKALGVKCVAYWWFDDPFDYTSIHRNLTDAFREADAFFCFDQEYIPRVQDLGVLNVFLLPNASNVQMIEGRTNNDQKEFDLCFVGSCNNERARQLMELSDYSILVGGPYWGDNLQEVKNFQVMDKVISPDEFGACYRRAQIGINFHSSNCKSALNSRTFDISANGVFQLVPKLSAAKECFEIDEELVLYESIEELIEKIDYFLHEKVLREQIGYRAHLRTVSEHTYEHRMVSMIESLENCYVL